MDGIEYGFASILYTSRKFTFKPSRNMMLSMPSHELTSSKIHMPATGSATQRRGSNGNTLNGAVQRRGSNGNLLAQQQTGSSRNLSSGTTMRRGSNGHQLSSAKVSGSHIKINTFRDKLSKFKDTSFRRSMKFTQGSRMDSFSEQVNNSFSCLAVSEKRKVSFTPSRENVVHQIEACSDLPKQDIWWTAEELSESRSKGHILALTDPSVKKYLLAHDGAQREVYTKHKLSSENLKTLVHHLAKGYLGLEAQFNTSARIESIRDHVVSVVRFYREQSLDNSGINFNESFSSQSSCSVMALNLSTFDMRSRNVRNHASKMSASNRHFATAMGNVEYLASIVDSRPEQRHQLYRQTSL